MIHQLYKAGPVCSFPLQTGSRIAFKKWTPFTVGIISVKV